MKAVTCKKCNSILQLVNGYADLNKGIGFNHWICENCEREIRETITMQDNKIVTLKVEELNKC